jgi:rare lipoprotein A
MDGVKALAVLASIYYPGDGIVAKNNYQTSSGERYDQSASKCAALQWPLGTMLHLVRGRNNIDVTINDHGPYRRGRALDCTPAVDKALHLGGLGSVRVEPYPPLPKARPVEAQVASLSETDPMDATVGPPAGYDSDRSLRPFPLPSNDGPQRFYQPNHMGAARLLGVSAVIKIEAIRTCLFLVVVVVGVAFSAACFLERLLRDRIKPNGEPSDVTGSLPKWLNRNKENLVAKGKRRAEPRTSGPQTQEGLWCWLPA